MRALRHGRAEVERTATPTPVENGRGLDRIEAPTLPGLSPREVEIVRLVAKGYPKKTVAAVLDISPWTVAAHLRRIYVKIGVNCRAAMVARTLTGLPA